MLWAKYFSAFATRSIHAFVVLLGLWSFGDCSVLDMERDDCELHRVLGETGAWKTKEGSWWNYCEDGKWIDLATDLVWYRHVVLAVLNLGSCYQKGSSEVMAISIGWTTEESGFGRRQSQVSFQFSHSVQAPRPTLLSIQGTEVKRWVVNFRICAMFKNARSCTSFHHFVLVRNEVLVQGQLYLTSGTKDVMVWCYLKKLRPVLTRSASSHADSLFAVCIWNYFCVISGITPQWIRCHVVVTVLC
jgi:hypothetical protein